MSTWRRSLVSVSESDNLDPRGKPVRRSTGRTPLKSLQNEVFGLQLSTPPSMPTPVLGSLRVKDEEVNSHHSCPASRGISVIVDAKKCTPFKSRLLPPTQEGFLKENVGALKLMKDDDAFSFDIPVPSPLSGVRTDETTALQPDVTAVPETIHPEADIPQTETESTEHMSDAGAAGLDNIPDEPSGAGVPDGSETATPYNTEGAEREDYSNEDGAYSAASVGEGVEEPNGECSVGDLAFKTFRVDGEEIEIRHVLEHSKAEAPESTEGPIMESSCVSEASVSEADVPESMGALQQLSPLHSSMFHRELVDTLRSLCSNAEQDTANYSEILENHTSFSTNELSLGLPCEACTVPTPCMGNAEGSETRVPACDSSPGAEVTLQASPESEPGHLETQQSEDRERSSMPLEIPTDSHSANTGVAEAVAVQETSEQTPTADLHYEPVSAELSLQEGVQRAIVMHPEMAPMLNASKLQSLDESVIGLALLDAEKGSASLAEDSESMKVQERGLRSESLHEAVAVDCVLPVEVKAKPHHTVLIQNLSTWGLESESRLAFEEKSLAFLPDSSFGGSFSKSFLNVLSTPVQRAPILSKSLLLKMADGDSADKRDISTSGVETGSICDATDKDDRLLSPRTDSLCDFLRSGKRELGSPCVSSMSKLWRGSQQSPLLQPPLNSTVASPASREDWDISVLSSLDEKSLLNSHENPTVATIAAQEPDDKVLPGPGSPSARKPGLCSLSQTKARALQQQLLQMAEILMFPLPAGNGATPAERHSAGTWTTPVQLAEHGVNTSELFERKREFSVAEMGTNTDSLLWNLAPGSLASVPRAELESRLTSALIVAEALSQQLAAGRVHSTQNRLGPSDLRVQFVQTDHTEFNQGEQQYRQLFARAVERNQSLELQHEELQTLFQRMLDTRVGVVSMSTDAADALSVANEIFSHAREDQEANVKQMSRMRQLQAQSLEVLRKMKERTQESLRERDDMRRLMEDALRVKEAAYGVVDNVRSHAAARIRELELSLGSHQDIAAALTLACQQQVALNKEYVESFQTTEELYKDMECDRLEMDQKLSKATSVLRQTFPVLSALRAEAEFALREKEHMRVELDRAAEERNRVQHELAQSECNLNNAIKEIGDLRLHVTIMNSEVGVLRERLGQAEGECARLQHRNQELSAAERELHECTLQLQHAAELQIRLSSVTELNEFLQEENTLTREQALENEALVKTHLQALRERNLECEDLKQAVSELRRELDSTRGRARSMLLSMGEQLSQSSLQVRQLDRQLRGLAATILDTRGARDPSSPFKEDAPCPALQTPRHGPGSFVGTVLDALTTELPEEGDDRHTDTGPEEKPADGLGSGCSAFTRVVHTAPPKTAEGTEVNLVDMLSGLRETVSELCSSLPELRATEAAEKKELRRTVAELQEKNSALTWKYDADVENLREQLHALRAQAEKDQVILQQKIEEEKRLKKACKEMEEYTELFQQQRLENTVLRTELAGVKHSLQQAQVEARTLREEMLSSAGHTGQGLSSVDEKILLRKELENLKRYAMEMEESRSKLLDRAKRHRSVYEENQRKMEQELHCLDDMIETVRKTLSSIPSVVDGCPELQELKCYVN